MTSLIIGASSVKQLEQNVAALGNLEIAADELGRIDSVLAEAVKVTRPWTGAERS